MASKKITERPNLAGGQVSTDLVTAVDLSAAVASQNVRSTLNDLFAVITKNITDGAVRFQGFTAPAASAAGVGSIYFDSTANVFEGSRNAGSYQPLLFGSGSNTQIAYWGATVDALAGSASLIYVDATKALTLSDDSNLPIVTFSRTTVASPSKIYLGQPAYVQLYAFAAGTGGTAGLTLGGGLTGPGYPTSGNTSAQIVMGSVTGSAISQSINGVVMAAVATENQSVSAGGHGFTLATTINGSTSTNVAININKYGIVQIGANGTP